MSIMELRRGCVLVAVLACAAIGGACGESPEGRTYYERNIEPILLQKCAGNTSGCHAINDGDPYGIAAGNFDVTTFENVQKRKDVLRSFGAYPYPLLLIKAVGANRLKFQYQGQFRDIEVEHSGGGLIDVGSDAYFTLQTWLDNGATENGLRPASPPVAGEGGCSTDLPAGFDPTPFRAAAGFDSFKNVVQPILERKGCTEGSCHGVQQSDFYITCGDDEDQLAFNFSQAWAFVNSPVDDSQLLRVPLGTVGGRPHTGGDQFPSTTDTDFVAIRTWAESVGKRPFAEGDALKQFFEDNVQPVLVKRGCGFQACHSPESTNDFKMRSGAPGFFSAVALEKNYELLRNEFMAIEYADARRGRAVAKALLDADPRLPGIVGGISHRGGPVLETPGVASDPAACPPFDPMTSTPFCTIQEWIDRERAALGAQVTTLTQGAQVPVVYVERPAGSANVDRLQFEQFRGGAELKVAQATLGANSSLQTIDVGAGTVISDGCGLGASPDIQSPNVANDGTRVVFAGRATAADTLGVYIVNLDGSGCQRLLPPAGANVHDFDPVFSPDGAFVVFASTRGKAGPVQSRKRFLLQSDLWRVQVTGNTANAASLTQMTFLSNSEIGPAFMREGRVTMTTEKASAGFYQLSGRRLNWDLTDYHPLLAQRKDSLFVDPTMADLTTLGPSIGYSSATDIREAADGDFLFILADTNADGSHAVGGGAGALAIFNRSIGPFEQGRADIGYLQSLRLVGNPAATGRAGSTAGYRRPYPLPDGTIMAAFASDANAGNFEIHVVNPRTNDSDPLFTGNNGRVRVDAVLAIKHPPRKLYENRRQLVFGGAADLDPTTSILYMPDAPMVFTLLVANLRRGRPLEEFDRARRIAIYSENPCTANCTPGAGGLFESRTLLGTVSLAEDRSVKIQLPSATGVVLELQDDSGAVVATMGEEHQLGPGERVSMGVRRDLHNAICGGCHGSITGSELDVAVTPDALTGASASTSLFEAAATPR